MKVFVHYKPNHASDAFEGTRLRKTIKGACEVMDIAWVDTPQSGLDAAHFLSCGDLPLLRHMKEKGVPCVVSCFYAEDDPEAAFLAEKNGRTFIPKKAKLMMNEADLVLVPDERLKVFASGQGITSRMEVLPPAVRMNRFLDTTIEAKIFRRYFQLKPDVKTVVATGRYNEKTTIDLIKNVAKGCPNLQFYFFGVVKNHPLARMHKWANGLRKPKNLKLTAIVGDDIYRSALMNSLAYISNDSVRPDLVGPLEAFASKTQVVAFASPRPNPLLVEGKTCRFFDSPEAMADYLNALNSDSSESTIEAAYAEAKDHNLIEYGKKLGGYYESLRKEDDHD